MATMVEIDALTKHVGPLRAVDGISFSVERGEVLGFLGPNGAGKSTTMKMVTGFLSPDSGSVRIGGEDISDKPTVVKSSMGYLPEGAPLYGDMTPLAFLNFIADIRGLKGAEKRRRVDEVIQRVHIDTVLAQPTETLSKGYKRRVGLAQAILHDPKVLILDEPTDGLDPNQKHEVRKLIQEMAAEKVIILSTHILEEVDAVCSRAVIIAKGRLLADGTPEQLLTESTEHNAVVISVSGPDDLEALAARMSALEGVQAVEPMPSADGELTVTVYPDSAIDLREVLIGTVNDAGWTLHSVHKQRGRLDDVFRQITTRANEGEAA